MIAKLARRLRHEHGDVSAISVVIGSVLFLLASIGIWSFFVTALGAGALAQANTDLTTALQSQVQSWEKTPWSELQQEPPTASVLNFDGKNYPIVRSVDYTAELSAYTIHIAAQRAVMPGSPKIDCSAALTGKLAGCMAVSGNVVATPDEVPPAAPAGVTLSTQQIDATGKNTNQITNGDFENATADPWTLSSGATVVTSSPPRATGSKALNLQGVTTALSNAVPVVADDQVQADAWFQTQGTQGAARLSAVWSYAGTTQTTTTSIGSVDASSAGTAWTDVQATIAAPAGATSVSLLASSENGATTCGTGCSWNVDDVYLSIKSQNIVPDPGVEAGSWSTAATGSSIVTTTGRTATSGSHAISLPLPAGASSSAESQPFALTSTGTYTIQAWARTNGTANTGTGTVLLSLVGSGGQTIGSVSANLNGIPTDSWTAVYATVTVTAPDTAAKVVVTATPGATGDTSPVLVDDFSLVQQTNTSSNPSQSNYLQLATIDGTKFADQTSFRVSFAYNGNSSTAPTDLKVGVYCSTAPDAYAVSTASMQQVTQGANLWYWSRIVLPQLSRLQNCSTAVLRAYSQSGATPTPAQIGTVSVLSVLSGITGQNHGTAG